MPLWTKEKGGRGLILRRKEAIYRHLRRSRTQGEGKFLLGDPEVMGQDGREGCLAPRPLPRALLPNMLRFASWNRPFHLNLLGRKGVFCFLIISLKPTPQKVQLGVAKLWSPSLCTWKCLEIFLASISTPCLNTAIF